MGNLAERDAPEKANLFKRVVALHILRGVVMKTPVDTGRARANWQVGVNRRPRGQIAVSESGGQRGTAGGAAITKGTGEIATVQPGEDVWISNNLPYIEVLENGSSKQAPNGMVGVTLAELDVRNR